MTAFRSFRPIAALTALALLSGCISFGSKAPPQLLTLAAPAAGNTAEPQGTPLAVVAPETPRKLDGLRVPVQVDATSIAYIKDAQWVDTPRRMFGKLLADRIAADGVLVLDPAQFPRGAQRRLIGNLDEFGIDAETRTAIVSYEATLTQGNGSDLKRKRFTASVPVRHIRARRIGEPLNRAAQQVADEVAAWVAQN
jgi:cholesterol transport system auxiliary component